MQFLKWKEVIRRNDLSSLQSLFDISKKSICQSILSCANTSQITHFCYLANQSASKNNDKKCTNCDTFNKIVLQPNHQKIGIKYEIKLTFKVVVECAEKWQNIKWFC